MITLEHDVLVFRFPEVHANATLRVEFQRTLRIPDDNREYPLPPGLGHFPLRHVDDYAAKVPEQWSRHGGVFLPMYQAEAMWINFSSGDYPFAVKVAAGKINAVTGQPYGAGLHRDPQDYVVTPGQPWLDGFCIAKGQIRQFVAMPLGQGYTAEEQLTGAAEHGGLQLCVYPMRAARYQQLIPKRSARFGPEQKVMAACAAPAGMGLAPGGVMRQHIYDDPHGLDAWESGISSRCFVHIVNSLDYAAITGKRPPGEPPTARAYTGAGLPWFDYYAADLVALEGSKALAGLDSVAALGIKKGQQPLPENEPVSPKQVKKLGPEPACVREGEF